MHEANQNSARSRTMLVMDYIDATSEAAVGEIGTIKKSLTLHKLDGIIPRNPIQPNKALTETSMPQTRSQRTRVGVSRATPTGGKSFLSVN